MLTIALCSNAKQVIVRGVVQTFSTDSIAEPLPYAFVSVLNDSDSAFVKGCSTIDNGSFAIEFTPKSSERYILRVSYAGLRPTELIFKTTSDEIDVGRITLSSAIELDEVVVTATPVELIQKGDTTIINANAYNLPEGAYLEELVKRIPGLEYDRQTKSLSYNGQYITGIDINGQPFFNGDNSIALQNLPAEVIDKIKIYNKSSEIEKFIGIKSDEENYVLDLQTKRKFNGTLITSIEAGAGNEHKRLLDLISNYFKQNGDNLSLIARSDNRHLTTDYTGNIDNMAALNFNKKYNSTLTINGSVNYNGRKMGDESAGYTEEYLISDNRYHNTQSINLNKSHNFSSLASVSWQANENTMLSATLTYGYNTINSSGESIQALFSENPGLDLRNPFENTGIIPSDIRINTIELSNRLHCNQNQYSARAEVVRLLNKRGTNISFSGSYSANTGESDSYTNSTTSYYLLQNNFGGDSILYRNQHRLTPSDNQHLSVGAAFTYPFNSSTRLQLAYTLKSDRQSNHTSTYDLFPESDTQIFVDSLSNGSLSNTLGHEIAIRFNHSNKAWRIEASFAICPEHRRLDNKTGLHRVDTVVNSINYAPKLSFRWQKGKSTLNVIYSGATRQPSLTDLIVPPDNSDPLNIVMGNPSLKATYRQSLRLEWRNTGIGLTAIIEGNNEYNSLTRAVEYNPSSGGRISYPVNINGNRSLRANLRFQKRIRLFNISANARSSIVRNVSLLNEGKSVSPERNTTDNQNIASDIKLGYNPSWGGCELTGAWGLRKSVNLLRDSHTYVRDYSFGANIFANLPFDFSLSSNLSCELRNGTYIESHRDDRYIWNIQASKKFLKSKALELCFNWVDILNQRKSINISSSAYGYSETYTNQIGSYFLVTLKFRFNKTL
jgi:hypothetical protein